MKLVFISGRFLISLAAAPRRSDGPPGRKLSLNELFLALTKKVLDLGILSFSIRSIIAHLVLRLTSQAPKINKNRRVELRLYFVFLSW